MSEKLDRSQLLHSSETRKSFALSRAEDFLAGENFLRCFTIYVLEAFEAFAIKVATVRESQLCVIRLLIEYEADRIHCQR